MCVWLVASAGGVIRSTDRLLTVAVQVGQKEQGRLETVLPDYSPYVSAKFVTE
jgi:ABC-type taurine transport system substrate-binding protein